MHRHFQRVKCRHHPHSILDISPVYLTRGISIAGGFFVSKVPFFGTRKTTQWKQALGLTIMEDLEVYFQTSPAQLSIFSFILRFIYDDFLLIQLNKIKKNKKNIKKVF